MKVIVLGTRGIPDIQGGVETHCQELFPRLAKLGCEITVITRKPYVKDLSLAIYKSVKLKHIFAPKKKSIEAIVHTFLGIIYAKREKPDILHIHAIGPSLLVPFAKLLGLKVVVTNHGPDYDRQKWGSVAKFILRLGEKLGTLYADKVIVISEVIKNLLIAKYRRQDSVLIYNGVNIPNKSSKTDYIQSLGLKKEKYIIAVGRFVEEKGFHDLVKAYSEMQTEYKLVLVGDADHDNGYSLKLKKTAKENGIILTGFIKGEKLNQIYSNARLFVMPSYHEGLPIALLEAMSYDLDVLVSNIPANLEVNLSKESYFNVGDTIDLEIKIKSKLKGQYSTRDYKSLLALKYNWDIIALKTLATYQSFSSKHSY